MNPEHDEIYDLIAKSFAGELTEDESVHLNSWKAAEKWNLAAYNDFMEIWKHSNRLVLPSQINLPKSLETTRQKQELRIRRSSG